MVLGIILLVVGLALVGLSVYMIISGHLISPRESSSGPFMAGNVTDEVRQLYRPSFDMEGNRQSLLGSVKWMAGIGVVLSLIGLIVIF